MKKQIITVLAACILLAGCANDDGVSFELIMKNSASPAEEEGDTGFKVMEPGYYDSADTAVVADVNEEEHKISFLNLTVNKQYTLSYDGTTALYDKYGEALSMAQVQKGDIVDVAFQKIPKKCVSIRMSEKAWVYSGVDDFEINQARKQIIFAGGQYLFTDKLVLASGGETVELMDLNERDVLDIQGIGNTVHSIRVTKGHGYLRLENAEYFVGGWIEVGQKIIQHVTEDMLLVVPEGTYQVTVSNGGHNGTKEAVISRDEETVLDVGDLKGEEIKNGNVFFTLNPPTADVYLDGEKADTSSYVTLEYGIHQMIVKAEGYETITQYLKVGQENANLSVEMEPSRGLDIGGDPENGDSAAKDAGGQTGAVSGNSVSANGLPQTVQAVNGVYYVKLYAPVGAEVYVDGNYVGIAPVNFKKQAGTHMISLRKAGYQTRSYTIQVDSEPKDMELSFSDLVIKNNLGEE